MKTLAELARHFVEEKVRDNFFSLEAYVSKHPELKAEILRAYVADSSGQFDVVPSMLSLLETRPPRETIREILCFQGELEEAWADALWLIDLRMDDILHPEEE